MVDCSKNKFEEYKWDDERLISPQQSESQGTEQERFVPPFIQNLFAILEGKGHDSVVSWNENGKEFTIHSLEAFKKTVFPQYFSSTAFSTFVRQVSH